MRVGSSMFFSWLALLRLTEPPMACFGRTGTCFCCGVCGASAVPVHCPPQTNQILKKKKNPPGNSSEARRRRGTAPCVGDSRLHFWGPQRFWSSSMWSVSFDFYSEVDWIVVFILPEKRHTCELTGSTPDLTYLSEVTIRHFAPAEAQTRKSWSFLWPVRAWWQWTSPWKTPYLGWPTMHDSVHVFTVKAQEACGVGEREWLS